MKFCDYCDAEDASLQTVFEPTEHETYTAVARIVCEECHQTYREAPWGFPVE